MARAPGDAVLSDDPVHDEPVYEPPMLVEVGSFQEVTRGNGMGWSDFPHFGYSYWLI